MTRSIRFGDWVWDPNKLELRNGSHVATLEPRVARLLEYLLDHPGELLSHDRIIEAVWDGRVVSNEAIRSAIFSLRQALAVGGGGSYIRTIHKKGYISAFPKHVIEDPDAGDQSATPGQDVVPKEATPVTVSAAPTTPESAPVHNSRGLPLLLGIAAVVALAAATLTGTDLPWFHRTAPTAAEFPANLPATVAVLPFTNLSREADAEVLANGLAEELLGTLALNPELRVTARQSAFQFRGPDRDLRDAGQRLGVRYLLDGSVRSGGDRLRIHTRLVDVRTGKQLWGDEYDRSLADWFDLQQVVAAEVTRALQGVQQHDKPIAQAVETTNVQAHLEVLRARQLLATRAVADTEQAIEHLQRALLLDPNYAPAYARLADAILMQAESTSGIKAARPVVAPLLDRALELDPGLGEAYCLRSLLTDDPEAAERDLRRGLELNPSYARGYELLARLRGSVENIDSAIALDPLTPGNYHAKALLMMGQGKWQEAAELDRRALELNPNYRAALTQLSEVYAVQGYYADAIGYARRAVALDPRAVPMRHSLETLYLALGDIDAARAVSSPSPPFGNWAILWAEGRETQIVDTIYSGQANLADGVDTFLGSQILLRQAVSDGDYARALAVISPLLSPEYALPPELAGWGLYAYANLVQLLVLSGDTAQAMRLQNQIEERMANVEARFPRHTILNDQIRAVLLARAGRSEEACAALERSYSPRPRPYWRVIFSNPAFDGMRSAPCFQALRARTEKFIAGERRRVNAMEREDRMSESAPADPDRSAGAAG